MIRPHGCYNKNKAILTSLFPNVSTWVQPFFPTTHFATQNHMDLMDHCNVTNCNDNIAHLETDSLSYFGLMLENFPKEVR